MGKLIFVTTTSTGANKGVEALRKSGIKSEIRKIQGGTAMGCLYGIAVDKEHAQRSQSVLSAADIRIISVKDAMG